MPGFQDFQIAVSNRILYERASEPGDAYPSCMYRTLLNTADAHVARSNMQNPSMSVSFLKVDSARDSYPTFAPSVGFVWGSGVHVRRVGRHLH